MTAVEWLESNLIHTPEDELHFKHNEECWQQAKVMEEKQKGYSKEEVIQLLIKMNSWPTTFDGEADISEWFEQFKSE
jgi:hypothetical protein